MSESRPKDQFDDLERPQSHHGTARKRKNKNSDMTFKIQQMYSNQLSFPSGMFCKSFANIPLGKTVLLNCFKQKNLKNIMHGRVKMYVMR